MSATIITTFRANESNRFIAHIQITGDVAGDLTNQAIIDSKAIIAGIQAAAGMTGQPTLWKINKINWDFTLFTATLIWDGAAPQQACALPQYDGSIYFTDELGAPLVNGATTPTGKLLLTTKGLTTGYTGTIVIQGRHK